MVVGEKFQKKDGARDFFLSIAKSGRGVNFERFLTGPPLEAGAGASVDRREERVIGGGGRTKGAWSGVWWWW